jgi:serine/threonine-protein kinase RsbW
MLKLSSDPRNVALVESVVEQLAERYRLSPDVHGNMLISLTEAVNNAIIHGNCNDHTKTVQIQFKKRGDAISICVTDEGCGFDPCCIPDPTAPENLLKTGGRGVFLIQQLSDAVAFHNNGSTVEMQFKI